MYIDDIKKNEQPLLKDLPKTTLTIKSKEWENALNNWMTEGKDILSKLIPYLCYINGNVEMNNLTFSPLSCTCIDKGGQEIYISLDCNNQNYNPIITIGEPSLSRTYECEYYKGQEFIKLKLKTIIFYEKTNYFGRNITSDLIEFAFQKENQSGKLQLSKEKLKDDAYLFPHEKEFKKELMALSDLSTYTIEKLFTKIIGNADEWKIFSLNIIDRYKDVEVTDCLKLKEGKLIERSVGMKFQNKSKLYELLRGNDTIIVLNVPLNAKTDPTIKEEELIKQFKKAIF